MNRQDSDLGFRCDYREFAFLLWEQFAIQDSDLKASLYQGHEREFYEALLLQAKELADELALVNRLGDREGCRLGDDGKVAIPASYYALWERFKTGWLAKTSSLIKVDIPAKVIRSRMPPVFMQICLEMFMGANPAFMTYGGFTLPAARLLVSSGSPAQQERLLSKLLSHTWDACFCATEMEAGSDLTAITTVGTNAEADVFEIKGEKVYISAGMHELTPNTLYFILGKSDKVSHDSLNLSCYIVPRLWVNADGSLEDNHVECIEVPDKMGLRGCANTRLRFGHKGASRAWLLGGREHIGLLQMYPLMSQARMSTGLFAVGIASSAYLHAVDHASKRIQGRAIESVSDKKAERIAIVNHADVQRMLFDMKWRVEGCRALLAKLSSFSSRMSVIEHERGDEEQVERLRKIVRFLVPIAKAYVSDQAWKVCELSMQVFGGIGYTCAKPVEQSARDARILSIWEGTNYMQAQDLMRDKLGYGRQSLVLKYLGEEIGAFISAKRGHPELSSMFAALESYFADLERMVVHLGQRITAGKLWEASQFFTRILECFGALIVGWVLLEAADIAQGRLDAQALPESESDFYAGKLKSARYFYTNVLPMMRFQISMVADFETLAIRASADEFAH